jgi:hypothetical protein
MKSLARAILAAAAALAAATGAMAQEKAPPAWDTLVRCAEMTDPVEELACYRSAMRAAGYAPSVASAEQRRKKFGLSMPNPTNLLRRAPKEKASPPVQTAAQEAAPKTKAPSQPKNEADSKLAAVAPSDDENLITVTLAEVATLPPANKLLIVTNDGAVWEQTDSEPVRPFPKSGQTMQIRRTSFGGYFCRFDKNNSVRCIRKH